MIQVTYEADFTNGSDLDTQLSEMSFEPLNQGELEMSALVIESDPGATWTGELKARVVQFTETDEFLKRVGPGTDEEVNAKKKAFVKNLFGPKISAHIRQPVTEVIVLDA